MPISSGSWKMSSKGMNYVDARKLWKKTKHLYQSEKARDIWFPALCKMRSLNIHGGWNLMSLDELQWKVVEFDHRINDVSELLPHHFDSMGWRYFEKGETHPKYWDYVCSRACHFMIKLYHWVIVQALPEHDWQIISSDSHSTIWNGKDLIYDPAFQALQISAGKCFDLAFEIN